VILCIDDCAQASWEKKKLLEHRGYAVVAVSNGRDGLSVLRRNVMDAVIVDLQVPGESADCVVCRLKGTKAHVPVLLVSPGIGAFRQCPTADAVMLESETPSHLLVLLDKLLNVKFPYFVRWFGDWKSRAAG
jgi:CheY-like chemotaxis protein